MCTLSKIKNSKALKWLSVTAASASLAVAGAFSCFAAEESTSGDLSAALTSSFDSIKGDIFTYIGIALPTALAIVGAIFGVKYAIKFFTNMSKKGG